MRMLDPGLVRFQPVTKVVAMAAWFLVIGPWMSVGLPGNTTWGRAPETPSSSIQRADIVVYGGTSGGVAAAIQAARMGKSVILIEPTQFVGGLTTGGLGATDIGNKRAIGGISREFYERIFQCYQDDTRWTREARSDYFKKRTVNKDNETSMWTFEPSVALHVMRTMLSEANVVVAYGERLDLQTGVTKQGATIATIRMESGKEFQAKVFIDATYEGDLMAKAGVHYHVGRESNDRYGETINGLQIAGAVHHQFIKNVDPYVVPGDRSSGLLPGVWPAPDGKDGDGDHRIQAYNFRMCTTDVAENRVPWPKPPGYEPMRYELLLRNFEAGDRRVPWSLIWMPNRKTDINNNFAVSTDNIGMNYEYPDGDYATRKRIWDEHEQYQKGLMWTLANHPRVPAEIRAVFTSNALAKDEFLDNQHWPRQLYVREARRMVSDYVMSEKNCLRREIVDDSVGMGAYNMDSHNTQRYVDSHGFARNEGDIQIATRPYPISYRSIRPRASECDNLLVPVCLAASHIAYGSIRMEPVFMVLGQSASTAACLAIDQGVSLANLPYTLLAQRLLADKQVLDFESPPLPAAKGMRKQQLGGILVDDREATLEGFTHSGNSVFPFVDVGYAHDGNESKGQQTATFSTTITEAGTYRVRLSYTSHSNRASNVPVEVVAGDSVKTIVVNQRQKPGDEGLFLTLGEFEYQAGQRSQVKISNAGTDGFVVVDSVQWLRIP